MSAYLDVPASPVLCMATAAALRLAANTQSFKDHQQALILGNNSLYRWDSAGVGVDDGTADPQYIQCGALAGRWVRTLTLFDVAKIYDAGADTPVITPRTSSKSIYLLGANAAVGSGAGGGSVVIGPGAGDGAGQNGDVAIHNGSNPTRGVTLLNRANRGDGIASLAGAEGTVVIASAGTEPGGGAVADHIQLMSGSGYLKVFGAYSGDPAEVLAKVSTSSVVANEIFTAAGTHGEVQGAGCTFVSLKFERASDGEDFLTLGSVATWHTPVGFAPGGTAVATAGDIRGEKTFTVKARNSIDTGNYDLLALAADALTIGDAAALSAVSVVTAAGGYVQLYGRAKDLVKVDTDASITTIGATNEVNVQANGTNVLVATPVSVYVTQPTTVARSGLVVTPTAGLTLQNETAATAGVPVQVSPYTGWQSQVWDTDKGGGGATATIVLQAHCLPVSSATPLSHWVLQESIDGGAATNVFRVGKGRSANPTTATCAHIALLGTELMNYDGSNMTLGVTGNPTYVDGSTVNFRVAGPTTRLKFGATGLAFFGGTERAQQTITGALSTVADAPAKAVLTSIIAALCAATGYTLCADGTT